MLPPELRPRKAGWEVADRDRTYVRPHKNRRARRHARRCYVRRRSEEHTSELQSQSNLVCRILLEKKNWRKMRKFDLSLRSSRSSYFATFRHQLTILSKTDALDEEKWLNMLGTFVKHWFRYESHFVHGRDSLVDILIFF